MQLLKGPAGSQVIGFGHYQPANQMTNHDVAKLVDTTDEWIQSRTGIITRHIAEEFETVADMATAAGRHALTDANIDITFVDLIIVATTTATDRTPNTAGRIAHALGATSPAIIDINTACSGFCHALALRTVPSGPALPASHSSSPPRNSPPWPTGLIAAPAS